MPQPLTIWCNAKFPAPVMDRVRKALAGHCLLESASANAVNLAAGAADPLLEEADIAWGQPDPDQVTRLPRLRLVQLTSAGYTRYDTPAFRAAIKQNGTAFCNASSIYAEPCAQHLLAMMLSLARRIPQSLENQRDIRGWPYLPLRLESRLLGGQTVLIVGHGTIGRRLADLLAPFEMNVIGFRRSPKSAGEMLIAELDAWLPRADHVINILPQSGETDGFFNAARFVKLKRDAIYYNIGRGSTNDEAALESALRAGTFAAAYIDAFVTEPLPKDHPLWTTPNCFITPHTGGGHSTEFDRHVDLFLENFKRLQAGQTLIDRIM